MLPVSHPAVARGKTGLLLVNLGSPERPDVPSVRRFLNEFLSDPRVVEIPKLVWQPILKLFVLTRRPAVSAANYAKIWDNESGLSPLIRITQQQTAWLQAHFADLYGDQLVVDYAMRYGTPSIGQKLQALRAQGCERIVLAPLYPQYSGATTGTVLDKFFSELQGQRWLPAVRTLEPYYAAPAHIAALKASIERQIAALDFVPEKILVSFHGMPKRTLDLGDPYYCQCHKTARLLREAMGKTEAEMPMGFQSRFGKAEWLQPYVQPMVEEMARSGVQKLAVVTPGFAADCIETLEEIALEVREAFLTNGGQQYAALACLNNSDEGMQMLATLLEPSLAGWVG